jgi:hypothetical protein
MNGSVCYLNVHVHYIWIRAHMSVCSFQHSPSFRVESESSGEMFHLGRRQGLGERVGDHVIGWSVYEAQETLLNDPADEVVAHIDMFHVRVVLVVPSEGNCGLVVGEECGGQLDGPEYF